MKTAQKKAVISGGIATRARQTMELVEQLKQILSQKHELEELSEDDGWLLVEDEDSAARDALKALELSEREVRNELRKLSGEKPLQREKGFLATISEALGSDEEESDEESDEEEEDDEEEGDDDDLLFEAPKKKRK